MTKRQIAEVSLKQATLRRYNRYSLENLYLYHDYCNEQFIIEDGKITGIIYGCQEECL